MNYDYTHSVEACAETTTLLTVTEEQTTLESVTEVNQDASITVRSVKGIVPPEKFYRPI
jgi:hypothetical protein